MRHKSKCLSRVERDETKRRSCEGTACFSWRREQECCLAPRYRLDTRFERSRWSASERQCRHPDRTSPQGNAVWPVVGRPGDAEARGARSRILVMTRGLRFQLSGSTVSEAATRVGYTSLSHFSCVFQ